MHLKNFTTQNNNISLNKPIIILEQKIITKIIFHKFQTIALERSSLSIKQTNKKYKFSLLIHLASVYGQFVVINDLIHFTVIFVFLLSTLDINTYIHMYSKVWMPQKIIIIKTFDTFEYKTKQ